MMIPEGQPELGIPKIMMIPFDGNTEPSDDALGLIILMHQISTPSGNSPLLVLSSTMRLRDQSHENDLLELINDLNFKLPMPGLMLTTDEHASDKQIIMAKFLLHVVTESVDEGTLMLMSELFNGLTSALGAIASVASGEKSFEQAQKELAVAS